MRKRIEIEENLLDHFTIQHFLKENSYLFIIIGVIGTMIALLPNLGDKILGNNFFSEELSIFPIILVFIIVFGCLFSFCIFLIIIDKIWKNREKETSNYNHSWVNWWKKGDTHRWILTLCLFPMMSGFFFLIFIALFIPNFYAILVALSLFCLILILANGYILVDILNLSWNFLKTHWLVILFILFSILLAVSIVFFTSPQSLNIFQKMDDPHDVTILTDQQYFNPIISNAGGIKLDPTNTSLSDHSLCLYHWSTNYGYFIQIVSPNSKIKILGNNFTDTLRYVYWTFNPNDFRGEKTPVQIRLEILNFENNSVVTSSSVNLTWLNDDVAFVNRSFA